MGKNQVVPDEITIKKIQSNGRRRRRSTQTNSSGLLDSRQSNFRRKKPLKKKRRDSEDTRESFSGRPQQTRRKSSDKKRNSFVKRLSDPKPCLNYELDHHDLIKRLSSLKEESLDNEEISDTPVSTKNIPKMKVVISIHEKINNPRVPAEEELEIQEAPKNEEKVEILKSALKDPNKKEKKTSIPIINVPLMHVIGKNSIVPVKPEPTAPTGTIKEKEKRKSQDLKSNENRRIVQFNSTVSTRSHPPQHKNSLGEISKYTKATIYPGLSRDEQILLKSPGLGALNSIEKVFIKHKRYVMAGCSKCKDRVEDQYHLINPHGHEIFHVVVQQPELKEKKKSCRMFRPKIFECYDVNSTLVIKIIKIPTFGTQILRRLKVYSPSDNLVGYIDQLSRFFVPTFLVKDHEQNVFSIIKMDSTKCPYNNCKMGPWTWFCRKNRIFSIKTLRGAPRGRIRGDWDDLDETLESMYPHFGVHFPGEMSVTIKTLIVSATIVIYRKFFHDHPARQNYVTPYSIMRERKRYITGSKLSVIESRYYTDEDGKTISLGTIIHTTI